MPGKFVDQAKMTVSGTPGTGTFTLLAAVPPFNTFALAGVNDGDVVPYSAIDGVANVEKGWGVYNSAGPTLTRNVLTSTNGNAAISASSSTQVFIDPSFADLAHLTLAAHANFGGV